MDWSKAKNIIIAALIAANLFLGYTYFSQQTDLKAQARDSARYTAEYLELMGAQLNCSLPLEREKLPVVFVNMEKSSDKVYETRDGKAIVVTGQEGFSAQPADYGDTRAQVISASDAVRRTAAGLSEGQLKGLSIDSVRLVYLVDRMGLGTEQLRDTALPFWEIESNRGVFYQEAFAY